MFKTNVDLETDAKPTDSKDAVASKLPSKHVLLFGAAAAILVVLSIIGGVVFSQDDTPPKPTLSTHNLTVPAPLGGTVQTHTPPLPTQALVFAKKYFVPLVVSAVVLVLVVVAVVVAAVFLKPAGSVMGKADPEPNWHEPPNEWFEHPEEPLSVGALVGIAAGVVVAALALAYGAHFVVKSCSVKRGTTPLPGPETDPLYINRNPDEVLPTAAVCLERFKSVMAWVKDGTIKKREGIPEAEITRDGDKIEIPDVMNDCYNEADMAVALNDPTKLFLFYSVSTNQLLIDPNAKFRGQGVSFALLSEMNTIANYEDENFRTAIFRVIKELESRIPADALAI